MSNALKLVPVSRREAGRFFGRFHYLGSTPENWTEIFGWRYNERLVAVASYGQCHVPKLGDFFRELQRLAASPEIPKPLSAFLSATIREMKRRNVEALITWADPHAGHHGGIYQATNWVCCVPSGYNGNTSYKTPEGEIFSHRLVFDRYGTCAKEKVLKIHPDWVPFRPPIKHRYIYPLTITKDDCLTRLKASEHPYPKPDWDGISSPKKLVTSSEGLA